MQSLNTNQIQFYNSSDSSQKCTLKFFLAIFSEMSDLILKKSIASFLSDWEILSENTPRKIELVSRLSSLKSALTINFPFIEGLLKKSQLWLEVSLILLKVSIR